jgi:predicted Rossmann fold flavoprotein
MENHYDVVVIGGGASGVMAAAASGRSRRRTLLIEKNPRIGHKLSISGGGRCNIMNANFDVRSLLSNYGDAADFLYSSFAQFGPQQTWDYFHNNGLPLIVEANNRAFPQSQSALDVVKFFERELSDLDVMVSLGNSVTKINREGNHIVSIETRQGTYTADSYIIATGGLSHPETGSTGDGFKWLRDLGHTVIAPTPSLVPLAARQRWVADVSGASLDDCKITVAVDGVKAFQKKGRLLFTHRGVSGPMILNSSKAVSDLLHTGVVTLAIDMFPSIDHGTLDKQLLEHFDAYKNKTLKNVLPDFISIARLSDILISLNRIDPETRVHSLSRDERKLLVNTMKALTLEITGLLDFDKAIIADGGIPLSEIDTKTFRSKVLDNLAITGDLLHINRPSGGFSLQLCWTSGFVAGTSSAL